MNTGIYQIRNLLNNKLYIGSAIAIDSRWRNHYSALNRQQHENLHLQRAWNKYGAEIFIFEILLYCDPENCLIYEQMALDTILFANYNDKRFYQLGYNICRIAGSRLGVLTSDKTKKKLRIVRLGYKMSDKSKQKVSLARQRRGLDCYNNKFTALIVNQVEKLLKNNIPQKQIAQQFQMSQPTVSEIKMGKHWSQRS